MSLGACDGEDEWTKNKNLQSSEGTDSEFLPYFTYRTYKWEI